MANPELEKNQKKFYDDSSKFIFEASGGGVSTPAKSQELDVLKSGIRLHFLRYGLFDHSEETNVVIPPHHKDNFQILFYKNNEIVLLPQPPQDMRLLDPVNITPNPKGISKLSNFKTHKTSLAKGYIYLINDDNNNDHHEIYVDESAQLQYVLWEKNKDENNEYKDIRTPSGKKSVCKYVTKDQKYWIAFSRVQWSIKYHSTLNTDPEKRKIRMKMVVCSGIKKGEEHDNAVAFTDISAVFKEKSPQKAKLEKVLTLILKEEENQDSSVFINNHIFEDMFITLDDYFGMAYDIDERLNLKFEDHKGLVNAIQSGESYKTAIDRVRKGDNTLPNDNKLKYHREMYSLALTTYHLIYNKNTAIRQFDGGEEGYDLSFDNSMHPRDTSTKTKRLYYPNYNSSVLYSLPKTKWWLGEGVNLAKLLGILGKKDREANRKIVMSYRNDLGNYLKSRYFIENNNLDDYLENIDTRLVDGRLMGFKLLENIVTNPIVYEKSLILKRDYYDKNRQNIFYDDWHSWAHDMIDVNSIYAFTDTEIVTQVSGFENIHPFYALLSSEIDYTDYNKPDELRKKLLELNSKILLICSGKYKKINIDETKKLNKKKLNEKKFSSAKKAIGNVKKIGKSISQINIISGHTTVYEIIKMEARMSILVDQLRRSKFKGQNFITIRNGELGFEVTEDLKKFFGIKDEFFSKKLSRHNTQNILNKNVSKSQQQIRIQRDRVYIVGKEINGKTRIDIKYDTNYTAERTDPNYAPKYKKLSKLLKSPSLAGFFLFLEYVNFANSLTKLIHEGGSENTVKTIGNGVKVAAAFLSLRDILIARPKAIHISTSSALGIIGAGYTAAMCIVDGNKSWNNRDKDAAIAHYSAGIALVISAGGGLTTSATAGSTIATIGTAMGFGGPVVWVSALIGLGFLTLAYLLTDTELEKIFKLFLFSDYRTEGYHINETKFPQYESPMKYTLRLFESRTKLVDSTIKSPELYYEPRNAFIAILDRTVCTYMNLEPEYVTTNVRRNRRASKNINVLKRFVASFRYISYFTNKDQVEVKLFIQTKKNAAITSAISNKPLFRPFTSHNGYSVNVVNGKIKIEYNFNKIIFDGETRLLFCTRLRLGENEFYPFNLDFDNNSSSGISAKHNKERWLAVCIDAAAFYFSGSEDIKFEIDTLNNLKRKFL